MQAVAAALSDGALDRAYSNACARRPGVSIDRSAFASALRARVSADASLAELALADLLLALACVAGDSAAIATFEAECMPDAARALGKLRVDRSAVDEILQAVRTKVLVGQGGPPKIVSYSARGSLAGWVRAIAVHEALSARRTAMRRGPEQSASVLDRMPAFEPPEIAQLRATYAAPFKAAFAEVLASLATRDRNVLRLVYIDGLTAEQVGLVYGVHRVSVARWLGQIRESLFGRTRRLLQERLRLSPAEFDSVTRLCLSQIDVSLDRLLVESVDNAESHGP